MKKLLILFSLSLLTFFSAKAQNINLSGHVSDFNIDDALIGVNIVYAPGKGTVTDIDGNFALSLEPGKYTIQISYVGYEEQSIEINLKDKPINLDIKLKTMTLREVEVVGDLARTRETPIAFSNVTSAQIDEQLASQDIPMILNATPGVYATQSGGGDGDARINIRGFSQRNVAVMLDGIPVNDMENGWVYWSNWFGLDAVMRGTQVQRGLGMSKLAIPSVGGTINITSKGIDAKKGVNFKQELGNAGYTRSTLGLTSGRMKNGWGVTFAGSYKKQDGLVDQTWSDAYFYFLRVDKEIGKHVISLSAMGAPQTHGQRSYKKHIATFDRDYAEKVGMRSGFIDTLDTYGLPIDMGTNYNPNWGYLSRAYITDSDTIYPQQEALSTANNYYHKPMFNLRDFWKVNDKLFISNIAYLSIGTGGGRSFSPTPSIDTTTNQQDLQKKYNTNINLPWGFNNDKQSYSIMRNAVNNHFWYGLLSTFDYKINDAFSLSGGLDLRSYRGEHYREVHDLFGGNYFYDDANVNESDTIKKYEGDIIGYHNDAIVRWAGVFAQLKYQTGNLTSFINLSTSYSGYKRIDYFLPKTLKVGDTVLSIDYNNSIEYNGQTYDRNSAGLETNTTDWEVLKGFTVKGGLNYNINERMNAFVNLGYLSKAPRFQNVWDRSNKLYLDIQNEKVQAIELGYSYVVQKLVFNANAYYTVWQNKPSDKIVSFPDPSNPDIRYTANINNMNALHKGIEFELGYRPIRNLSIEAILSLGDWKWTSADSALIYNDNNELIAKKPFNAKGLYVGDAAQFQTRESVRWEIIDRLYVTGVFTWFGKNYSEFNPLELDPEENPGAFDDQGNPRQSWKIPDYFTIDFHAGYSWKIKNLNLQLRGTVLNALNSVFITDAQNNDPYLFHGSSFDANSAGVFMGLGRRFTVSLKLSM